MKIFVFEFVSGGGLWSKRAWGAPCGSLLREGLAMLHALIDDLAAINGVHVVTQRDIRIDDELPPQVSVTVVESQHDERQRFEELSSQSDYTWIIAPEIENVLTQRCERCLEVNGRLLGTSVEFSRLASDKQRTIDSLVAAGVPVIDSNLLGTIDTQNIEYPAVVKPRWGAGSVGLRLLRPGDQIPLDVRNNDWCVQPFVEGVAASVGVLRTARRTLFLPPCRQSIDPQNGFKYAGGETLSRKNYTDRAWRLADQVVKAIPVSNGLFGIDLIFGDREQDDKVVEVNPRFTTSFVGLRSAIDCNLPELILQDTAEDARGLGVENEHICRPIVLSRPVRFSATGTVEYIDGNLRSDGRVP